MLIDRCLCGSSHYLRDVVIVAFGELPICACWNCGTKWAATAWTAEQLEDYYASGAYHRDTHRHADVVAYKDRYDQDRIAAVSRLAVYRKMIDGFPGVQKALDVGAANGAFVDVLRTAGIDAHGVELDPSFQTEFVHHGGVVNVRGPFDAITYHDVLEHLADPLEELAIATAKLEDGGLLIVEVPDVHVAGGFKHFKMEHVWYFSLRTLIDLMTIPLRLRLVRFWYPIPGKLAVAVMK
jgi:2-polyprenyl-3-methyl-5-hydroxy-6-metoxy-1,4-benzoquinol methylase